MWYDLYFTEPISKHDKPTGVGLDQHLVDFIDQAKESLDMCIYDFDLENIADAFVRASERGVKVRAVFDNSQLMPGSGLRQVQAKSLMRAGIPIVSDDRAAIMHNKFVVRDHEAVWTGSWNFTYGDTWNLNNVGMAFYLPQMAANYSEEFHKMFDLKQFGPEKAKGVPYSSVAIPGGGNIYTYFSPQDNGEEWIVNYLRSARESIYFLAFSFTSHPIGHAMIERALNKTQIRGVVETTGALTKDSQYLALKDDLSYKTADGIQLRDVDVRLDGNPYPMHHKFIVVDERTVLMGSFNFSTNANAHNDENLNIIEHPGIAKSFLEEFGRVQAKAKTQKPLAFSAQELRP